MRRLVALPLLVLLLVVAACSKQAAPPKETPPPLTQADLQRAVLTPGDVGAHWKQQSNPDVTTVQIGGKVGPANVGHESAQVTSAFVEEDGTGSISDSVLLITSVDLARAIMRAHRDAAGTTKWTQQRDDGSTATFERTGPVPDVNTLGDDTFSQRMKVQITDREEKKTNRRVDYVVFRMGAVLGFVVTQDKPATAFAGRQERRVAALLGR